MDISYEATIEDVCEPKVRHFLRSKTFTRQRISGTLWAALISPAIAYCLWRILSVETSAILIGLIALVGPLSVWLTHADVVKKRICKHIERELESRLPTTTKYSVTPETLKCESFGVEITFLLKDLQSVQQDNKWLEISFGSIGFCIIPLRAFHDEAHKKQFLGELQGKLAGTEFGNQRGHAR